MMQLAEMTAGDLTALLASGQTSCADIMRSVLAEFPGRKVLVTPGMVELGTLLEQRHTEFGRQAAGVCYYIILVGPRRTAAIAAGATAAGFAAHRLIVVSTLKEATARLGHLVAAGDVVLFENDLPDQYSEQ